MLGLSLATFTAVHVIISLIGIAAGLVWLISAIGGRWASGWNSLFLATTIATSITGFMFPRAGITPAQVFGVLSLLVLAVALFALYGFNRAQLWKLIYAVTATVALYLNVFVLVVQSFLHVGPLHALAPTGTEPPFAAVQGLLLISFVVLGILVVRRGRRVAD